MSRFLSLLGLALFTLAFGSALRSSHLARWMGRLGRQFRLHHGLGVATGFIVVSHIIWELSAQPWSLSQELVFTSDPALLAAWFATIIFLVAFYMSYKKNLQHRKWYAFHLLFPLAFFIAIFHAYEFRIQDTLDTAIVGVSAALGCGFLLQLTIRRYWQPGTNDVKVKALRKLTDSTWEVELAMQNQSKNRRKFLAGDIVYVRFPSKGFTRALHPFTVASCRFEPNLRLYIKSLGRDTSHLQDLTKDSEVQIIGPYSELRPDPGRPQLWVAGGIGIAPFMGFLQCMDYADWPKPVQLMHFISSETERMAWDKAIGDPKKNSQGFHYQLFLVENKQLDFRSMDQAIRELGQPLILICGPHPFMSAVRKHLKMIDVPSKDVKTEEFIP